MKSRSVYFHPTSFAGLDDQMDEGTFVFSDRTYLDNFNEWAPGSPKSGSVAAQTDCVILDRKLGFKWNNVQCSEKHGSLCDITAHVQSSSNGIIG